MKLLAGYVSILFGLILLGATALIGIVSTPEDFAQRITSSALILGLPSLLFLVGGIAMLRGAEQERTSEKRTVAAGQPGQMSDIQPGPVMTAAPLPPVQMPAQRPAFTALDEFLMRLESRLRGAEVRTWLYMVLAILCLLAGAGLAGYQIWTVSESGVELDNLGSAAVLTHSYVIIITNGLSGLIGFALFGWFGLANRIEASHLRTTIDLERARMFTGPR